MKDSKNRHDNKSKQPGKEGDNKAAAVNGKFSDIIPIQAQPLEVKVYNNNFDKALRAFRALVQKERILSIYKEKQSYEKPTDKRRRKRNEMKRKQQEINSFDVQDKNNKPVKSRRNKNSTEVSE